MNLLKERRFSALLLTMILALLLGACGGALDENEDASEEGVSESVEGESEGSVEEEAVEGAEEGISEGNEEGAVEEGLLEGAIEGSEEEGIGEEGGSEGSEEGSQEDKKELTLASFKDIDAGNIGEYVGDISHGNSDFAFDLYAHIIATEDGNVNFSPFSISTAFAMLYAGARENTEDEMTRVFNFDLEQEILHPAYGYLIDDLQAKPGDKFMLTIANGVWAEQTAPLKENYVEILTGNYNAEAENVDFISNSEEVTNNINNWVSNNTNGMIKKLFPNGTINSNTRMVLANAVYFKADWEKTFNLVEPDSYGFNDRFTTLSGDVIHPQMMSQKELMGYAEGESYVAAELGYDGSDMSMLIVVPTGDFSQFEQQLNVDFYEDMTAALKEDEVELKMPKFKFSSGIDLNVMLKKMGISDMFNPMVADLSGISELPLFVSSSMHKAYIDVNEKGTEAAAATGIVSGVTSIPDQKFVTANKPFIYIIRDKSDNSILFLGRVVHPEYE